MLETCTVDHAQRDDVLVESGARSMERLKVIARGEKETGSACGSPVV